MKKIYIIIITIFFIASISFFLNCKDDCFAQLEILEKRIDWTSMEPILVNGRSANLMLDYYNKCGKEVKKWDIIAYDYWGNSKALIKQVKVTSEDRLSFSWLYLLVNGEILVNSKWEKYHFDEHDKQILNLYIKNWKIPHDSFFIFWDNVGNSIDSRKFWAISPVDIIWKFDL